MNIDPNRNTTNMIIESGLISIIMEEDSSIDMAANIDWDAISEVRRYPLCLCARFLLYMYISIMVIKATVQIGIELKFRYTGFIMDW